MEARALITASENGLVPRKIDTKALFSVFGNETFFFILREHFRVYEVIRHKLSLMEYKEVEDFD